MFQPELATSSRPPSRGTVASWRTMTNHTALLWKIDKRGNKQHATGRTIVQEMEYDENNTVRWYSGAETLDISGGDVLTASEFAWKQIAGTVTITGLEEIQNSGREAIHNLLKARIKNLTSSLKNSVATAMFADGTGTSGKEIGGLQLLIADDSAEPRQPLAASTGRRTPGGRTKPTTSLRKPAVMPLPPISRRG